MEDELRNKLEEDGWRKMIYKLDNDRNECGKDMNGWGPLLRMVVAGS